MSNQTTYTNARANLARLFRDVTENREVFIVHRSNGEDVAIVAADELANLQETAYLLRSPANAKRLLQALVRAQARSEKPQTVDDFKKELGIGKKA